ncbi:NAD-P-binding protein [Cyathus striatus]|nr:NAD-P-binding protein [Cyathus striatus]
MDGKKSDPEVWFITGASSGLGLCVLKHVLSKGDNAVATLRKPEAISDLASLYPSSQLLIVQLDVKNEGDILSAFRAAEEKFGRVDVVYNNAGYGTLAEIEGTPLDLARDIFEVNFWGSTNVSREAVRFFRDVNKPPGGRLLQASSQAGSCASAGLGYYCASKYALEGFSEALSQELLPSWNIKVIILQIGGFVTRSVERPLTMPLHPSYTSDCNSQQKRDYFAGPCLEEFGDANKAAREMYKIAGDENAPLHIPLTLRTIAAIHKKIDSLKEDVAKAEKWSVDLK